MKSIFERVRQTVSDLHDKRILPIFAAVLVSFVLATLISVFSLTRLANENTREIDTMLTYRIYDSISNSLNEPIVVSRTMACDNFLAEFLKSEKDLSEDEAVSMMQQYLSGVRESLEYDSVFLVSESSRRYYTYDGLNKIVDPENDDHDIWYSLFIGKDKPYDLDVDSDEVNHGKWTVFVNVRIEDEAGKLLGVCGVGVQMENLQELFLRSEREYNVKINLVDPGGLVQVDTEDINIENAWFDAGVLGETSDETVYQTMDGDEYVITKYVEYLGWYLVVRSAPAGISKEVSNVILLSIALLLLVMLIMGIMIWFALVASRRVRKTEEEAATDKLTGFLNKYFANEKIGSVCERESGIMMIIDLDSFKLVNDIYGHEMGDRILAAFADIVRQDMPGEAVFGRIGGDEFLVFAPCLKAEEDIRSFTDNVNTHMLEAAKELMGADMSIPLGASIGAISVPEQGRIFEDLFRMCDRALYKVKSNGKHGYSLYTGENAEDEIPSEITLSMLTKILEERNTPQNAMWMGKEAFRSVYRYMLRYMERYQVMAYKVMFTARFIREGISDPEQQEIMAGLRELLQESFRNSDMMMQLGRNHFFLMLPKINEQDLAGVVARVVESWKKSGYSERAELLAEAESLERDIPGRDPDRK